MHPNAKYERWERFWMKVAPTNERGCRLWTGMMVGGYGRFRGESGLMLAHRWAYESARGAVPDGMMVLHKCDVSTCVNPEHLMLGTQAENMADCSAKGRSSSKLSRAAVATMREAYAHGGTSYHSLSLAFGVSTMTAYNAVNRVNFRSAP
jgi:hypothetical protein